MRLLIFSTIILFFSLSNKSLLKTRETQINTSTSLTTYKAGFKNIKQNDSTSYLSRGSKHLLFNFPKGGFSNDKSSNNKNYQAVLNSIYGTYNRINNLQTSSCYTSDKEILHNYFESEDLVDDASTQYFEHLAKLPKIHGFEISIDKVTKKCNKENNLNTQYCLTISKNEKIIRRYNIGYIDYGDLNTSLKYWYISKDYTVYTRIFGEVAEEDDEYSSTFISKVNTYIITKSGHLVPYYNKNGAYKTEAEEGLVKNHLKEGIWIEKKQNGYLDSDTCVKATYKNGLPIDKWHYYKLELIEEVNADGYIIKTYTKKTDTLMMTEVYSNDGELLKREILEPN